MASVFFCSCEMLSVLDDLLNCDAAGVNFLERSIDLYGARATGHLEVCR